MAKQYLEGTWQQDRSFSPAVISSGGRTVWLAGHGGVGAEQGPHGSAHAEGDAFEQQVQLTFERLAETLQRAGGTLQDIVTMTVFITDPRHGTRFTELRKDYFPNGYPASALITVSAFAVPEMQIEIQGIAFIDDD